MDALADLPLFFFNMSLTTFMLYISGILDCSKWNFVKKQYCIFPVSRNAARFAWMWSFYINGKFFSLDECSCGFYLHVRTIGKVTLVDRFSTGKIFSPIIYYWIWPTWFVTGSWHRSDQIIRLSGYNSSGEFNLFIFTYIHIFIFIYTSIYMLYMLLMVLAKSQLVQFQQAT